jgi:hypothetical protein
MEIKWKDGLTGQDVTENMEDVMKKMGSAKMADNAANGQAIFDWLVGHKSTPTGIDGSEEALKQAIYSLHYQGKIQWDNPPRTQADVKKADEAKNPHKTLTLAEATANRIDDERAARVMANLRSIANTGNYGRHSTNDRVRAGLTTFLNAWTKAHPRPNLKTADAFALEFRKEETRLVSAR